MINESNNETISKPYKSGAYRAEEVGSTEMVLLTLDIVRKVPGVEGITINSEVEASESSTSEIKVLSQLELEADHIFRSAREQYFEDGYESDFSIQLKDFIFRYSKLAIDVINRFFINESVNKEVLSEALRVIGRIKHTPTYRDRLWLLEHGLYSSSSYIRDGAILGLASINDPDSIIPIKNAIEREKIPELRHDMEQVLKKMGG